MCLQVNLFIFILSDSKLSSPPRNGFQSIWNLKLSHWIMFTHLGYLIIGTSTSIWFAFVGLSIIGEIVWLNHTLYKYNSITSISSYFILSCAAQTQTIFILVTLMISNHSRVVQSLRWNIFTITYAIQLPFIVIYTMEFDLLNYYCRRYFQLKTALF